MTAFKKLLNHRLFSWNNVRLELILISTVVSAVNTLLNVFLLYTKCLYGELKTKEQFNIQEGKYEVITFIK